MNNILDYRRFLDELETYEEINEKNSLRNLSNRIASHKVKLELSEEIELSQSIMTGIKDGLESLSNNFDEIKKDINKTDDKHQKGEKEEMLDSITKLIEQSKKSSWDLNDLIDEGEIDYTGFAANVGFATLTYFGVLLFPIRARFIVHKGYNYFFATVKNTIRKALVMLQLNFDQFENLIITKGFQSMDYLDDMEALSKARDFQELALTELTKNLNKQKAETISKKFKTIENQFKLQLSAQTKLKQSSNIYNCLDQYNNTYTKSLETLRQYSQEDVQKHLDSIKTSMNKIAAGDPDLTAYGELIIAAAEEHAYKVSTSIYNKFAKMTEVFSLPNQKKMIDLIQEATQEKYDNAVKEKKKLMDSEQVKESEERLKNINEQGEKIFKSVSGVSIGKLSKDGKYSDISGAYNWTYNDFKKLGKDDQEIFTEWLGIHKDVFDKCNDTLKVVMPSAHNDGYFEYIDSLIDYISPCIREENINESFVQSFDEYVNEARSKRYFIDMNRAKEQVDDINKLYKDNKDVAIAALEIIGNKFTRSKFADNAEIIVDKIINALDSKTKKNGRYNKVYISLATYDILTNTIIDLKEDRSHDYQELLKDEKVKDK